MSETTQKLWQTIVLCSVFLLGVYVPFKIVVRSEVYIEDILYWLVTLVLIADSVFNIIAKENDRDYQGFMQSKNKYRSLWITIDIVAAIPFLLITGNIFLELIRLVKLARVVKYVRNIFLESMRWNSYLIFIFFIYWFLLITHWLACGWVALNSDAYQSSVEGYITSLYWCIQTVTTVGYGDVVLSTVSQEIYAMVVMLFGVGVYGYIIGNVANILLKRDPARTQYFNNIGKLRAFVNFRNIPQNLQKRIRDYYEYIWRQKLGYNESDFIIDLPDGLKTEVELYLKRDMLEKIPLFKGISDKFIREVSLCLKPVVYTPGDYIFRRGDKGTKMYFVIRGKLKILSGEDKVLNEVSDGDFFGELALFRDEVRSASVQAITYCDLYVLSKEVFEHVLNNYPEISTQIRKVAEERLKNS